MCVRVVCVFVCVPMHECACLYICVYVFVSTCVSVDKCVYVYMWRPEVEAIGLPPSLSTFLRKGLSLHLELVILTRVAGQKAPLLCLFLCPTPTHGLEL